jgi:hypothetical protein
MFVPDTVLVCVEVAYADPFLYIDTEAPPAVLPAAKQFAFNW